MFYLRFFNIFSVFQSDILLPIFQRGRVVRQSVFKPSIKRVCRIHCLSIGRTCNEQVRQAPHTYYVINHGRNSYSIGGNFKINRRIWRRRQVYLYYCIFTRPKKIPLFVLGLGIVEVCLLLLAKFAISGSFNLMFLYTAELFPTHIRWLFKKMELKMLRSYYIVWYNV